MRTLIVGTAGHIDHGKTALVRALTGIDTDRLPEEKQRGITIDIGFARMTLADGTEIGIVDVPGHEAFIRNMLAGATGIDIALLVVAADEGVMPQTREHLAILELLGVRSLIVVITKTDLVGTDWLDLVRDEVAALLDATPYRASGMIAVSAITGDGLDTLVSGISDAARTLESRDERDAFRLPIDRVFTVKGTGTVVTGTVWSGHVATDAVLRLLPADQRVRVRAIQSHGTDRDAVRAGERAALALAGTARTDLGRGDCLVDGDGWDASRIVTVRLHALPDAPAIRTRLRVRFHLGTAEVFGRIALLEPGPLEPGGDAWAQVRLETPVVARAGDHFVVRSYSPVTTIAGGRIVEPVAPKRKRTTDACRESFRTLLDGSPENSLAAATELAGFAGLPGERVPIALPHGRLEGHALDRHGFRAGNRLFHPDLVDKARASMLQTIAGFHDRNPLAPGILRESLRHSLPPHAPVALADAVTDSLVRQGSIIVEATTARMAAFQPRLAPGQQKAADALEALFRDAGLASPGRDEIPSPLANRPDLDDLLHFLQRAGRLIPIATGRWLHPASLETAIALARTRFAERTDLGPADFRDLFGISRKYLIPLLEHLDRTGVTTRIGDSRRVEPSVPD